MALDLPVMAPSQALALRLAEEHLTALLPPTMLGLLKPLFNRARQALEQAWETPAAAWAKKVRVIGRGPALIPPAINPEVQQTASTALFDNCQVVVTYRSRDAQGTRRYLLNPLGLVFREGVGYLVATAKGHVEILQFALHRMSAAQELSQRAARPPDFDLDRYIFREMKFGYPVSGDDIRLRALFESGAAFHLSERPLSKDQRLHPARDGWTLLTTITRDTQELRWWLLGFGDGVEVLEPKNLRKDFADLARRMEGLYRGRKHG